MSSFESWLWKILWQCLLGVSPFYFEETGVWKFLNAVDESTSFLKLDVGPCEWESQQRLWYWKGYSPRRPNFSFSFLLAVQGLAVLVSNSSHQGHFQGFKFDVDLKFELLQFADDTVGITGDSLENIWCIKSILRGSEMTSGMSVNYNKNNLFGVNIVASYLQATYMFLACKIRSFPFLISLELQLAWARGGDLLVILYWTSWDGSW